MGHFKIPMSLAVLALLMIPSAGCTVTSATTASTGPAPTYPPAPVLPAPTPSPAASPVPAGTNGIGAVLISQGIQDPTGTLPLVAGRDATVRVFLAAPAGTAQAQPSVNVTLWNASGAQILSQNIPAPGQTLPVSPQFANFNDTWNLDVPGALLQPGTTFQASIVADAQSQGLAQTSWPADGQPQPLKVVLAGNVLRLTLVPVTTYPYPGGPPATGQVTSPTRALADWSTNLRKWFPVGSAATAIDIQLAPAWDPGLTYTAATEGDASLAVRTALERMRKATVGSAFRYYAGIFVKPQGAGILGRGEIGRPGLDVAKTCIVYDAQVTANPDDSSTATLVHELGHCMGRMHAPCGAEGTDDNYHYSSGKLGTWGLDPATHLVKDPQLCRDLMGYCTPYWISDYTYGAIQKALAADQAGLASVGAALATNAILVTGRLNPGGAVALDPFLDVQDLPGEPDPGPYLLTLYDTQGETLTSVPFGLEGETEGGPSNSFLFEVDLTPDQEARLGSATVTAPSGAVTRQLPLARARTAREPVAVAWKGGVHLGWDHGAHPEVLVRDPRSGAVIATAHGGGVDLATDATELELLMLDGLHTYIRRVKVTP